MSATVSANIIPEMRWFAVALVVASASAMNLGKTADPCDRVECRAGRECIVSGGVAQCLCVTSCPDHDKPVCGSDGQSYDNFCLLHQKACLSGNPISVDYKGYCKRDIELAMKEFGMTTTKKPTTTAAPVEEELSVCYGPQRDALRDTAISHWQDTVSQQPWYTKDMTYSESLSGHFFACDKDRDYKLRPDELIGCFSTMPFLPRPEQNLVVTRTLCIDAILEDADSDKDWKLDFKEFTHMLDPLYRPQAKNCSLEGKDYTDGAEVRVACNHCVCATGNWVCAAHNCPEESTSNSLEEDDFGYMDTKYDLKADKKDEDSDEYYDDDDLYDDYEDEDDEISLEKKYTAEEAKKEFNLLSEADQKKLTHLENNIKLFYEDVDRWNVNKTHNQKTSEMLNSVSEEKAEDEDYSDEDDLSSETEELLEDEEEEEDDLLDEYEALLSKSRNVRERLTALRTQINTLEDRSLHKRNQHHDDHYFSYGLSNRDRNSGANHHVQLNTIDHSNRRVAPATTTSRKYEKYEAYRATLDAKRERNRAVSPTDTDIWEDQWKAKIKKHHHVDNHL